MTITNKFWVDGRKNNIALTFLDDHNQSLQKGVVLNNYLAHLGPCWSLSSDL